ncbi:hypothetical protein GW891_04310 [bacterium]|nr:hypothetical protein [bacterium]
MIIYSIKKNQIFYNAIICVSSLDLDFNSYHQASKVLSDTITLYGIPSKSASLAFCQNQTLSLSSIITSFHSASNFFDNSLAFSKLSHITII